MEKRIPMPDLRKRDAAVSHAFSGNTTVTVFATNETLIPHTLPQVNREVHTSMARAIDPFQTIDDGDVLFGVTANEVTTPKLNAFQLGALASELAWDAVPSSFRGR
jgi:L-aminopeptidase/D-esterase-like protein